MAADGRYVTLADVAQYLQVDITDTDAAEDLSALVLTAEDLVDLYCNTIFDYTASDITRYFDGTNTDFIYLKRPIASITTINLVDTSRVVVGNIPTYFLEPNNGFNNTATYLNVRSTQIFPKGVQNIQVIGKFGFSTIPRSVKLATKFIVKQLVDLRNQNTLLSFEKFIDRSASLSKNIQYLPPTARTLLERWRLMDLDNYAW